MGRSGNKLGTGTYQAPDGDGLRAEAGSSHLPSKLSMLEQKENNVKGDSAIDGASEARGRSGAAKRDGQIPASLRLKIPGV